MDDLMLVLIATMLKEHECTHINWLREKIDRAIKELGLSEEQAQQARDRAINLFWHKPVREAQKRLKG